jgi:hypothetical protein
MMKLLAYVLDTTLSLIFSVALVLAVLAPSSPRTGEDSGITFFIGLSFSLIICSSLVFVLRNIGRILKRRHEIEEWALSANLCIFILNVVGVACLGFAITIIFMILTEDMRNYGWLVCDLLGRVEAESFFSLDQAENLVFALSWLISTILSSILVWSARRAALWWLVIYKPLDHYQLRANNTPCPGRVSWPF